MLTNNFRNWMKCWFSTQNRVPVSFTSDNGTVFTPSGISVNPLFIPSATQSRTRFELGSGTDAPTKADYKLAQPIASSKLQITSSLANGTDDSGKAYGLIILACSNPTDTAIRIAEVGAFAAVDSYGHYVLLDRTLLDSPITLAPGESCAIRYRLTNQFAV